MIVQTLFFAHLQDIVGSREKTLALPDGATVRELASTLTMQYPALHDLLKHARVAVNTEYADAETVLHEGDEVALLPPMSGGRPD